MNIKKSGRYFLYMLECRNGTYYTGSTKDLAKRIVLHETGKGAKYLRGKAPLRLVYKKEFRHLKSVLRAEREIKKLKKAEKEKLALEYEKKIGKIL